MATPQHIANPMNQLLKRNFEMLKLSAVIYLQPGHPDHLILIHVTSGLHLKDVAFHSSIAILAEMKARIAQQILNIASEGL